MTLQEIDMSTVQCRYLGNLWVYFCLAVCVLCLNKFTAMHLSCSFPEMAEHHNIKQVLPLARELVCKVQMLIENK